MEQVGVNGVASLAGSNAEIARPQKTSIFFIDRPWTVSKFQDRFALTVIGVLHVRNFVLMVGKTPRGHRRLPVLQMDGWEVRSIAFGKIGVNQINRPKDNIMDEEEILARLKAHVASQQDFSRDGQRLSQLSVDSSTIDRLAAEVWVSRDQVGQLNPRNPGLLNSLAQNLKKMIQRSLTWYTRSLQAFHQKVALSLEVHGSAIKSIEHAFKELENQVRALQHIASIDTVRESLRAVDLAIQEQQAPYVEFFRGLSPVVDIGCGSGGFLELLKHKGIEGYGVDSDRFACHEARRKKVTVVQDDMFHHLRQLSDRSLGGIFSARVIEYLPTHLQMEFISLCSQKIKSGGLIVIETMNPESTLGFGRNSYVDPTHLRPVPSELLKSALGTYCFRDIELCFLAPIQVPTAPTSEPSGTEYYDRVLPDGCRGLLGTPAYAVVGWRN